MEDRKVLEARFGPNPQDWPPPYRGGLAEGDAGRLHAALMEEGSEAALAQAVLTRLAAPSGWARVRQPRLALAGFVGAWLAVAGIGYVAAGAYGDDPLLALTLGDVQGLEVLQ